MLPSLTSVADARCGFFLLIQLEGEVCSRFEGGRSEGGRSEGGRSWVRDEGCPTSWFSCPRFRFREDVDGLWRVCRCCVQVGQRYETVKELLRLHTLLPSGKLLAGGERVAGNPGYDCF